MHAYQILYGCICCPRAGPFGALLRWKLAHFNGKLPGSLQWFPAGTYAANMVACATIFAAQVQIFSTAEQNWSGCMVVRIVPAEGIFM